MNFSFQARVVVFQKILSFGTVSVLPWEKYTMHGKVAI